MAKVKSLLLAAAAAVPLLSFSANPASALFGLICIPTLPNCMCTFQVPCPVSDAKRQAELALQNSKLKDALTLMNGIQEPGAMLNQALTGQGFFSAIPGIDAIGIDLNGLDINGLMSGDFASIIGSLPADLGGLTGQLSNLGISTDFIKAVAQGQLPINDLLGAVQTAGLDLSQLSQFGVDIQGLANGDISSLLGALPPEITGLASKLTDLGISADTLTSLARGELNAGDFLQIAGAAGVDFGQLQKFGLSQGTIAALAEGKLGPDQVLQLAQGLGIQGQVLSDMGITPELIQNVASGNIDASAILRVAQNAGLDMSQLEAVGLDQGTIMALANGAGPEAVMSILQSAGFDQSPISALGLDAGMLGQIASGQLPPEAIEQLLAGTGIDPSALVIPGVNGPIRLDGTAVDNFRDMVSVDIGQVPGLENTLKQAREIQALRDKIQALPQDMQNQVIGQLQTLQNEVQSQLRGQIDAIQSQVMGQLDGQLAQVKQQLEAQLAGITGNLPVNGQMMQLLRGNGIDIDGILNGDVSQITQKLDGAISDVAGGLGQLGGQVAGGLGGNVTNLSGALSGLPNGGAGVSQALGGLGGLGGVFGASRNSGLQTGGIAGLIGLGKSNDPMCQADTTLIQVSSPANAYGDDMATIDMAISSGSIEGMADAHQDAIDASRETAAWAFARSVALRPLIEKAYENAAAMEEMLANAQSEPEDQAINITLRGHLHTARAENASILGFLLSAKAARVLQRDHLSPVPLLPQDSRFAETVATNFTQPRNEARKEHEERMAAVTAYSDAVADSRVAIHAHQLTAAVVQTAGTLPETRAVVQRHEDYKDQVVHMEGIIKRALDVLYEEGGEAAFKKLLPRLNARAGDYVDPSKYQSGYAAALELSGQITAGAPTTQFGTRKIIFPGDRETPTQYSQIAATPQNYPAIDNHHSNADEPYRIIVIETTGRDADIPANSELVGALQYWFEAKRRTDFASIVRRSTTSQITMTSAFWNEMIGNAPQCISGPFQLTSEALRTRPDMFDLDMDCDHLTWSAGDPGDFIHAGFLGGADAAIWTAKITAAEVEMETGGPDQVRSDLAAALQEARNARKKVKTSDPEHLAHLDEVIATLQKAIADSDFQTIVDFP